MELHKNSAFADNDLLKACSDNIIQKSKFLKASQIERLTQLNRGENRLKEEEDEYAWLESEASFLHKSEVKWCCRETLTNFYLMRMNSKGNPPEEQAIRPLNAIVKSHSW